MVSYATASAAQAVAVTAVTAVTAPRAATAKMEAKEARAAMAVALQFQSAILPARYNMNRVRGQAALEDLEDLEAKPDLQAQEVRVDQVALARVVKAVEDKTATPALRRLPGQTEPRAIRAVMALTAHIADPAKVAVAADAPLLLAIR
jgi:hypothetical protein